MASATIPKPAPSPRRASAQSDGFGHDRVASLTPTRQLPTIQIDVVRAKIESRDRDAGRTQVHAPRHFNPRFCEAGGLRNTLRRPGSRNNTDDSTVLSKDHSAASSPEEDSDTSSDGYPVAPLRRSESVPPPHPLPPRANPRFFPPPPWHPPVGSVGPVGGRPPLRNVEDVDSSYSESESESEDSDGATRSLPGQGARPDELQQDIETKQRRIWQLRHEMARKRKELQELRHRKDNRDNLFMQIFRPHLTSKSSVAVIPMDVLGKRLGEMQAIRDEYYTAESAYEAMELELDTEELVLEKLEIDLSRLSAGRVNAGPQVQIPPPPPTMKAPGIIEAEEQEDSSDEDDSAPPSPPVTLLGISGERHEDIHPLYEELLEAAGDRQLAKEHVDDLEMHREKILYDLEIELHRKRVREDQGNQISEEELLFLRTSLAKVPTTAAEFQDRFGITITDDELDFLRNYESTSQLALADLASTTSTLTHLRALCLKKNVMRQHASYHEELAIFSSIPGWTPSPQDGNIALEAPNPPSNSRPNPTPSLAHPRFPILLSNPSHLLALQSPVQALQHALQLPKDDPTSALRRAECMKELGISTLMAKAASTADYINQWLIHRLRTSPLEAELSLAVCEAQVRVVNLRRWQEEVLYYWRLDEAAAGGALADNDGQGVGGGGSELDGLGLGLGLGLGYGGGGGGGYFLGSVAGGRGNSVIEGEGRVRSEEGEVAVSPVLGRARSVRSLA